MNNRGSKPESCGIGNTYFEEGRKSLLQDSYGKLCPKYLLAGLVYKILDLLLFYFFLHHQLH